VGVAAARRWCLSFSHRNPEAPASEGQWPVLASRDWSSVFSVAAVFRATEASVFPRVVLP
jgi:hypothetical protein